MGAGWTGAYQLPFVVCHAVHEKWRHLERSLVALEAAAKDWAEIESDVASHPGVGREGGGEATLARRQDHCHSASIGCVIGADLTCALRFSVARLTRRSPPSTMQPAELPVRILMIDDDVDLQSVLGELLESNGFVFASAHSAMEGLAVLDRVRPDVVVLDVVMEDVFAGFRVLAWLRRNPDRELAKRWRQVPVVLMSGVQSAIGMPVLQDAPRALLPIDACLEKPAEPSRVLEAIRACLARSTRALRSLHEPSLADGA